MTAQKQDDKNLNFAREVCTMAKMPQTSKDASRMDFKKLTKYILKSYLDCTSEEDMDILALLDENLSVIGTGKQEFFRNLQEFSQAFVFDINQRESVRFQWKDFNIEEQIIDEDHVLVYGSVLILGSFDSGYVCINMDTRFSILYGLVDGKWKVLHIHHSVPDKEQMENEEFPRTLGQRIEETQHMIMALAADFVAVYMIEPEADQASIVKLDHAIKEKIKPANLPEKFCYSQGFRMYADTHIYDEDRESFLSVVLPDALIQTFQDGREKFELNYRITIHGQQCHYSGLFIRISKPGETLKLIAGFRNIEDTVIVRKQAREKEKSQQRELAKSYQKLDEMREIFAASKMGIWSIYLIDGKAPAMEADDLMKELLGVANKDLSEEEVYDAWYSNVTPGAMPNVLACIEKMKAGVRDEVTYLWKHPVLGERYVRCGGTSKKLENGYVLRGYHYDVDDAIREQKEKDKALADQIAIIDTLSKSFRNVFVANLDDGTARVIRLDDSYQVQAIRDVNGKVFPFDAVVNRWVRENVHPEDKERILQTLNITNIKKIFSKQDVYVGTYRNMEDGVQHHYQYEFRRIRDSENVVAGFQVIDTIIEEHQALEKKQRELEAANLREEREHAEVISSLSTIYSTIFRAELDTHRYEVLTSVALMGKLAGKSGNFDAVKEEILAAFMAPDMVEPMREFLDIDTLADRLQNVNTVVREYKNPDGRWLQARFIVKRRDENGVAKEALYVARDYTDEKQKEFEQKEQLSHALAAAQQASKAKSTFLSSMSHDIRTPMNAIIGFTALAQTHLDNPTQVQDYLAKINTSSTHLLSLINDILDMSRIESGTVKLDEKPVHIPDLLHDLRTMIQGLVNSKNLNLYIDTQDVVNEDVITDKLRLNQILLNIVSNAIKFTQPGGDIIIRLIEKDSGVKNRTTYELSVKDNGIGMSREFQEHIFETFTRERSATVSGIQGTGLGMAITKNIVDMMGGEIHVESEEGKGSLFTVTLNLRLANEPVKNAPIPDLLGARALVVDDDINTCRSVSKMLRDIQMRPDWTASGKEAIIRAQDAADMKDEYKVYIIDYLMPDMNGIETVRRIRKVIREDIPIIVLTAYDWADFEHEAREAGVTAFVSKPIFMSELRNILTQPTILEANKKENKEKAHDYSGKRILLVEDNSLNREIATALLEETGAVVDGVSDGDLAVAAMNEASADKYDLILMDIQMPRMDGYTATREIRTLPDNKKANIPIVAMTANAFEEDRQKAFASGMNGHIIKPVSIESIAAVLDEIFAKEK